MPSHADCRLDSTCSTPPLAVVAGFFFAFRVFILLIAVRVFGMEPFTGAAATVAINYLVATAVLFDRLGRPALPHSAFLAAAPRRWATLFLAFSAFSLMWSNTASLPAATAFWIAMGADTATVFLLVRSFSADHVVAGLMKGFVAGASLVAVIAWIMPAQSDLRLGDEELLGPNQIGYVCAFAFFFAQYLARTGRGCWSAAAGLLVITVVRSLSKTTILALFVAELFLLVFDRSARRRTRVLILCAAIGISTLFGPLLLAYFDIYSHQGTQAETLTGRLGLWAVFLDLSLQQPWIGHGFHSVWNVIPPFGPDQFQARHAHNELLQQFYAYGVVGLVLIAGLYGSFFRDARKLPSRRLRALLFALLLFVLVRGLADTEPFDLSLPLWTVVLFSYLIEANRKPANSPSAARIEPRVE